MEQQTTPKPTWATTPYKRAPWVQNQHAKQIPPHKDQKSNLALTNDQVMRPRDEPIGQSWAFPLNTAGGEESFDNAPRQKTGDTTHDL